MQKLRNTSRRAARRPGPGPGGPPPPRGVALADAGCLRRRRRGLPSGNVRAVAQHGRHRQLSLQERETDDVERILRAHGDEVPRRATSLGRLLLSSGGDCGRVEFILGNPAARERVSDRLRHVDEIAGADHADEIAPALVPQRGAGDALLVARVERLANGEVGVEHHNLVRLGDELVRGVAL